MYKLLMAGTVVSNGDQQYVRFNGTWYLLEDNTLKEDLSKFPISIIKETVFLQDVLDLLREKLPTEIYISLKVNLDTLAKHT